jgi:YegS/Rv2252/BmrU family lipid kinase
MANQTQWSCVTVYTEYSAHAIELVRSNLEKAKFDAVVACGGDGTLNECVNGIMLAKSNVVLGILSLGTGNDFVKTLKIKGNLKELVQSIDAWHTFKSDVMCLETSNGIRFGINVSDIGIGGEVVQRMALDSRWMGSFLTYQKNIIKSFLSFKSKEMILKLDDESEFSSNLFMFAMSNASWFGSGLCIDPEAQLNDGLLNVVMVRDISIMDYFGQLNNLRRGSRMQHRSVTYHQCKEVKLISSGWPIDCDGEFIGHTPLSINLVNGGINILVPKTIASKP